MEMPGRKWLGNNHYRYGYNKGSEEDNEVFDGLIITELRLLDCRIGRWWSKDPEVIHWQSPYVSMDNNPIVYNDPDGDCPWCLFAIGKALYEGASELIAQKAAGKDWDEIDWADVGLSAAQGAIEGSGAGLLVSRFSKEVIDVAKAAVDVSSKKGIQTIGYGKSGADFLVDYAGGKMADKLISTKFNSKIPVSNKEDVLRKAYKVALKDFARTGTAGHAKNLKNMTVAIQKSMKENIKKDMVKKVTIQSGGSWTTNWLTTNVTPKPPTNENNKNNSPNHNPNAAKQAATGVKRVFNNLPRGRKVFHLKAKI